jgi:hypothetical protein
MRVFRYSCVQEPFRYGDSSEMMDRLEPAWPATPRKGPGAAAELMPEWGPRPGRSRVVLACAGLCWLLLGSEIN